MGYQVVTSTDVISGLASAPDLAGAVIWRAACGMLEQVDLLKRKEENPDFRIIAIMDKRGLSQTVAATFIGAVGQLVRPLNDEETIRAILKNVLGGEPRVESDAQ